MFQISSLIELDVDDRAAIEALARDCDREDGSSTQLSFDTTLNYRRDMKSFFLAREGAGGIVGFLIIFAPEADGAEITAMVAPAARRRGIFAALLAAAEAELRAAGYTSLLFTHDAASASGASVAAGWTARKGVSLDHREFSMLLEEAPGCGDCTAGHEGRRASTDVLVARGGRADIADLVALSALSFGGSADESRSFLEATLANPARTVLVARGASDCPGVLGMVCVFVEGGDASINALVVRSDARRKGIGSLLLSSAIARARERGASRIGLEVDALNRGALGIYLGRGFVVRSEIEYWRAPLSAV
jgi:ribosomal-protein-alanine N-acetyltransferase